MQHLTITDHLGQTHTITLAQLPVALTIAQTIYTSGLFPAPPLCSGLGRCGKCRVLFTENAPLPKGEDALFFNEAQLRAGWRLACHHYPKDGMHMTLPELPTPRNAAHAKAMHPLKLAVDLGTTTLHWSLLDGATRIQSGHELNPQMGAGSEVMSRLAFARSTDGAKTLQNLVLHRLQSILQDVGAPVDACCISGNSVMTYLLLGIDTAGLASAPYSLAYKGGDIALLEGLPPAYIPPLPAPFVGGDLTAGICAVEETQPVYPYLLADLGTNGEFVLAVSPDRALTTSVALGPALEGIGLFFGTVAQPGAITKFSLTPKGLIPSIMASEQGTTPPPVGISGTGYLSLVHTLLKIGLLDDDGRFATDQTSAPRSPLAARLATDITGEHGEHGEKRLKLPYDLFLSASDIEELLKVKAAFTMACERLFAEAGIAASDLVTLYLAGALGEHADTQDLEGLGFIPAGAGSRVVCIGNASLRGAERFLIDPSLRTVSEVWTAAAEHVDLTTDPAFTQNYMRHMRFK